LVELNKIEDLKNITEKVSDSSYPSPKNNTFTSEKMVKKTIDLYHQLLSTSS